MNPQGVEALRGYGLRPECQQGLDALRSCAHRGGGPGSLSPPLVRPGPRAERWPLYSPECEPGSLILALVWGLQGQVLFSGALPACLSGAVPEASGRHAPPLWLGFLPTFKLSWQCLQEPWPTARSSLCCVFREQRQNKINWFPGRSSGCTGKGGRTARLPACLPSPPGALAVGSHILSATFLCLVF